MAERGNIFGKLLCEALGIDPAIVQRIDVTAQPKDVLRVEVELIPKLSAVEGAREAARRMMEAENITVYLNWERPIFDVTAMTDEHQRLES